MLDINISPNLLIPSGILAGFLLYRKLISSTPNLSHIPAVGSSNPLVSFLDAFKFLKDGQSYVQLGIEKYGYGVFRVPMVDKWAVVLSTPELIDEVRRSSESVFSVHDAINEALQGEHTLGRQFLNITYHSTVVRTTFTRNLPSRFGDIRDEIVASFDDYIPAKGDDWVSVPVLDCLLPIICRVTNRLFVGLPLCRDPDYCDLNINLTTELFTVGFSLNAFPSFLRPLIGYIFSPMPRALKRCEKHLGSLITERLEQYNSDCDKSDRPNDLITWLLDAAPENERNVKWIMARILHLNFGAIHTTSNTLTQVLFQLAARPEYQQPLREEAQTIIEQEGWTKTSVAKMYKADSFIRETLRYDGVAALVIDRRVRKPGGYTLSDGTHLPQNTFVTCASWALHHKEENYVKPLEFDGFRFSNMSSSAEGEGAKYQIVTTAFDHLPFGHGRHACPGRFLAAGELKAMLAHVVLTYDLELESGKLPPARWFGKDSMPSREEKILFKRRQA